MLSETNIIILMSENKAFVTIQKLKQSAFYKLTFYNQHCVLILKMAPPEQQSERRLATTSHNDSEANWNMRQADRQTGGQDHVLSQAGTLTKNSAKRDTRPLTGRDLTHKCSLRGNPKRSLRRKTLECLKKNLSGSNFFKGSGSSVAPKPECGITKPSSRIAFNTLLTSSCSLSSLHFRTISLGALVGLQEKVGKASNQARFLTL